MELVDLLHRFGGVATRWQLILASSEPDLKRAVAAGEIVRDAPGRYAVPVADKARRAANRLSGVVSHRSAALHWGWELKVVPDLPDVTIPRKRHLKPDQAGGVALHWVDLDRDDVEKLVTTRERTLVDCMRSLPFDEALTVADSALRHKDITKERLVELADSIKGPGAPQARRVAREADGRAANPFESVLRAISLDIAGLDLQPQVVIADERGRGQVDLADTRLRWVIEADSYTWHGDRPAFVRDCRRYTRLVLLGWHVLRFVWEDVMHNQDYVRECLDQAVALSNEQAGSPKPDRPAA